MQILTIAFAIQKILLGSPKFKVGHVTIITPFDNLYSPKIDNR